MIFFLGDVSLLAIVLTFILFAIFHHISRNSPSDEDAEDTGIWDGREHKFDDEETDPRLD